MNDIVIQHPSAGVTERRALFLLFHGVGADAHDLRAVGEALATAHPDAWVVSVQAPDPSDLGRGWQWFSVQGVTPTNRAERVRAAMPGFVARVEQWQRDTGSAAHRTTLVGFSQGAIMALAATQREVPLADRVVAMAGRLPEPPTHHDARLRVHLLHGVSDAVVPAQASVQAHAQLTAMGTHVTLDLFPDLAHGIDARMMARVLERLAHAPNQDH